MKKIDAGGLKRPSSGLDDSGSHLDIDFYITAVSALLKLMQVWRTIYTSVIALGREWWWCVLCLMVRRSDTLLVEPLLLHDLFEVITTSCSFFILF